MQRRVTISELGEQDAKLLLLARVQAAKKRGLDLIELLSQFLEPSMARVGRCHDTSAPIGGIDAPHNMPLLLQPGQQRREGLSTHLHVPIQVHLPERLDLE
jgi:hypothetical protein